MHTPSTRILSALAYDRGEEYDPADPVCLTLLDALSLAEHAARRDRRRRPVRAGPPAPARAPRRMAIPAWFSAEDLIAAPWETPSARFL